MRTTDSHRLDIDEIAGLAAHWVILLPAREIIYHSNIMPSIQAPFCNM